MAGQTKTSLTLLQESRSFWLVLRATLTGSGFSALVYNRLVTMVSDAYSEEYGMELKDVPYALSHSRMQALPASVLSPLRELIETMFSAGMLTGTQKALAKMVVQKLKP